MSHHSRGRESGDEYHLVDLETGASLGGFATLQGARTRTVTLQRWQIFHRGKLVENHVPTPPATSPDIDRGDPGHIRDIARTLVRLAEKERRPEDRDRLYRAVATAVKLSCTLEDFIGLRQQTFESIQKSRSLMTQARQAKGR